jgi:hypothetical protein
VQKPPMQNNNVHYLLPVYEKEIHIETKRFMEAAVEMGSSAVMYILSFIKTLSNIHKLIWGESDTHRQHSDFISLLFFFFKIRKVG